MGWVDRDLPGALVTKSVLDGLMHRCGGSVSRTVYREE